MAIEILLDRETNRMAGLIDFGGAGAGDPAMDVGLLHQTYGGIFVDLALDLG